MVNAVDVRVAKRNCKTRLILALAPLGRGLAWVGGGPESLGRFG